MNNYTISCNKFFKFIKKWANCNYITYIFQNFRHLRRQKCIILANFSAPSARKNVSLKAKNAPFWPMGPQIQALIGFLSNITFLCCFHCLDCGVYSVKLDNGTPKVIDIAVVAIVGMNLWAKF